MLTLQQIQDFQEGPKGEKAIGVSVAKMFGGIEFRGTVGGLRTARKRCYYHVTYNDGDKEELSQTEFRDAGLMELSEEINTQRNIMNDGKTQNQTEETDLSEVETSDGEGSEYDKTKYIAEVRNKKRKRKENKRSSNTKKINELSGCVMPLPGDKTVAAEAYDKLSESDKQIVMDKVNPKIKKVNCDCQLIVTGSYAFVHCNENRLHENP
jgi:hypothetical protein